MGRKLSFIRFLVTITVFAAAVVIAAGAVYETSAHSSKLNVLAKSEWPRIGDEQSKVELLVIEDFRCGACQYFIQEIFPEINEKYIQTGRAYCVIVPVSFLEGSQLLANAALAMYQLAPKDFLLYLHAVMNFFNEHNVGSDAPEQLVALAAQFRSVDMEQFRHLMETNRFASELEQNLEWAKQLMGKSFGTPALFVNGIRTSATSIDGIEALIERTEKR